MPEDGGQFSVCVNSTTFMKIKTEFGNALNNDDVFI